MNKITYVLEHFGDVVGVIIAENDGQLTARTAAAIDDNIEREKDGQFELHIGRIGDFGEYTDVTVKYVENGQLVTDSEFRLRKTVSY